MIQISKCSWSTSSTSFVLKAQVTKVFSFSTLSTIVRFNVNCSDPCSVNLVNNTEITKIQNDQPYVSIYSQLTKASTFTTTETNYIQNGVSLVIKNKQPVDPMNTWVIYEEFKYTQERGLSTAEQVYIAMGVIAAMTICGFIVCLLGSIGCFLYVKFKPTQISKNDW